MSGKKITRLNYDTCRCLGSKCAIKETCLRYTCEPAKFPVSFSDFSVPVPEVPCRYHIPNEEEK